MLTSIVVPLVTQEFALDHQMNVMFCFVLFFLLEYNNLLTQVKVGVNS